MNTLSRTLTKIVLSFFLFCFFLIQLANAQTIVSVSPDNGQIGQILRVDIAGSNTNFFNGSSSIQTSFKKGTTTINAPITQAYTNTLIEVNLDLSNTSYPSGYYDLEMNTPAHGLLTLSNAFRIDTTALMSATPQVAFKGQTINTLIAGRAINFNNVTIDPYYFRNGDTIQASIVSPRTKPSDTLELSVDLSSSSIREGNYDLRVMTPGGPLFLRNALEVKTTNITGTVYFDANSNNVFDSGETGIPSVNLKILPSGLLTYSNSNGKFRFGDVSQGTHQVVVYPPTGSSSTMTDTQTVVVSNLGTYNVMFGLSNNVQYLLDLYTRDSRARCASLYTNFTRILNRGNTTIDGVYYFIKDSSVTFHPITTADADSVKGDTAFFSFSNLAPFAKESRIIYCDLPSITVLPIGSILRSNVTAYILDNGGNIVVGSDVTGNSAIGVSCSFDPNDKQVSPVGLDSLGYVPHNTILDYRIRFQNTGNDTAYRVVVLDTLSADLDLSTFEFLDASHSVVTELDPVSRELKFIFDNIFLVDSTTNEPASNGYIDFRISPNANLMDSTSIYNRAAIYFDFNPPVITNSVVNTFVSFITAIYEQRERINLSVSPNPSTGEFSINLNNRVKSGLLNIYDVNGKLVYRELGLRGVKKMLNLNHLENGLYILSIQEGEKAFMTKLIIDK